MAKDSSHFPINRGEFELTAKASPQENSTLEVTTTQGPETEIFSENNYIYIFFYLFYALRTGNLDFVIETLSSLQHPQYLNLATLIANSYDPFSGETLLHQAVAIENLQIAHLLIQLGANVNALNNQGNSILATLHFETLDMEIPVEDTSLTHLRDLLLNNGAQYIANAVIANTSNIEFPDIESDQYMYIAQEVDEILENNPNLSAQILYALNLISGPVFETLLSWEDEEPIVPICLTKIYNESYFGG